MNRCVRVVLAATMATLLCCTSTFAWNNRGHMMVAAVAYKKLTPQARTKVDALIQLNPDRHNWLALIPPGTSAADRNLMLFMIAATWPDRIKSDSHYVSDGTHDGNRPPSNPSIANRNTGYDDKNQHKYWHFVDRPFSLDGTALPHVPTPNAETQIKVFRDVLKSAAASKQLKSYDLSWLLHVVGDVHQPLHAVARVSAGSPQGDDGGNSVLLQSEGKLHSFWDGILGGGISSDPVPALGALATLPSPDPVKAANVNAADWIAESFLAAKTKVYANPPIGRGNGPFGVTPIYRSSATTLAQQQISLAGARLAKILNEELNVH